VEPAVRVNVALKATSPDSLITGTPEPKNTPLPSGAGSPPPTLPPRLDPTTTTAVCARAATAMRRWLATRSNAGTVRVCGLDGSEADRRAG
jgi:hypothetical protein